jgi:hypothetical protein
MVHNPGPGSGLGRRVEQVLDPAELVAQLGNVGVRGALVSALKGQHELPAGLKDPVLDLADIIRSYVHRVIEFAAPPRCWAPGSRPSRITGRFTVEMRAAMALLYHHPVDHRTDDHQRDGTMTRRSVRCHCR